MTGYLVILLVELVLLWECLQGSKFNPTTPGALFFFGMVVSTAFALIGCLSWNTVSLNFEITLITVIGLVSFYLGTSFATNKVFAAKVTNEHHINKCFGINSNKVIVVIILIGVALVIKIYESFVLAAEFGLDSTNLFNMLKSLRVELASFKTAKSLDWNYGYSFICRQLEKFISVAAYVFAVLLAKQLVSVGFKKKSLLLVLAYLASLINPLITGSRGSLVCQLLAFIYSYLLFAYEDHATKQKLGKILIIFGLAGTVLLVGFYGMAFFVGRLGSSSGLIEYITSYFGCGLPSFQLLLADGNYESPMPGFFSFYTLFSLLYKFHFVSWYPSYSIAWVDAGSISSNIYGPFARYYLDFGYIGVALLAFLCAFLLTAIYKHVITNRYLYLFPFLAYIAPLEIDSAREEFLFSRLLTPSIFVTIFLMVLITWFLTENSYPKHMKKSNIKLGFFGSINIPTLLKK